MQTLALAKDSHPSSSPAPSFPCFQGRLSFEDLWSPLPLSQLSPIASRFQTRQVWKVYTSEQMAPNLSSKAQNFPWRRWLEFEKGLKPRCYFAAASRERGPVSAQQSSPESSPICSITLPRCPTSLDPGRRGCQALPEEQGAVWAQIGRKHGKQMCVPGLTGE